MFLTGAEALGMTHRQCLDLLESAEDTLDYLAEHPPDVYAVLWYEKQVPF